MTIEPYGRAMFLVTSHGCTFTVDCLANDGNGACDCVHFLARLKPEIERDQQSGVFVPGVHQCPHIKFADQTLLRMFKRSLAQQFPDTKQQ